MRAALLLLLVLVACRTSQPAMVTLAAPSASARATETPVAISLHRIADDPHRSVAERCTDVFETFRHDIGAGETASAVHATLGAATWLGADSPIDELAGEVPVEWTATDQVVVFMCLPEPDPRTTIPRSPWIVYARLEGRDNKTFGAFLKSNGSKKLIEYALCYTDPHAYGPMKIERVR